MLTTKPVSAIDEFGDFQTPDTLAALTCRRLKARRLEMGLTQTYASILEPTCGIGNFLFAALDAFPDVETAVGIEIQASHAALARERLDARHCQRAQVRIVTASVFEVDWERQLESLDEPILIVGNPPWVTNSALGKIDGSNLPEKSNADRFNGLEAITGKSNFDLAEGILNALLERFQRRTATLAMLCKTAVARKVIQHAWKRGIPLRNPEIRKIDAAEAFGATVDACLFIGDVDVGVAAEDDRRCRVFERIGDSLPSVILEYHETQLLADASLYRRWKHLGRNVRPSVHDRYQWRSGVKHDCSKVMELRSLGNGLWVNGYGDAVDIEDDYLYPLLKGSEVAAICDAGCDVAKPPSRRMLVTQRSLGEQTAAIGAVAPKTWRYLQTHAGSLDRRASTIYRKRPRFSIFGVGGYTFSHWKVAISGFYKRLRFIVVPPHESRPVVLDDTSYFLACQTEDEARLLAGMLNSTPAREFFSAFVFWDAKRPITIELLKRLDLNALADTLGHRKRLDRFQI